MRALQALQTHCARLSHALDLCGKPGAAITLRRKDWDLIVSLPREAGMHGFNVSEGAVTYACRAVIPMRTHTEGDKGGRESARSE